MNVRQKAEANKLTDCGLGLLFPNLLKLTATINNTIYTTIGVIRFFLVVLISF